MKIAVFAGFLIGSLLLASCATATVVIENIVKELPSPESTNTIEPETTEHPISTAESTAESATERAPGTPQVTQTGAPQENQAGQPPQAVQAAVATLSQALSVEESQVQVVSYEQEQWPDSCLGLADPGEMCLQVITPGWLVLLDAGGKRYEIHTDETGARLRMKEL